MNPYYEPGAVNPLTRARAAILNAEFQKIGLAFDELHTDLNDFGTATSASPILIGVGTKTFDITGGHFIQIGQQIAIVSTALPVTHYMVGIVTDYDKGSGDAEVEVSFFEGAGTLADWSISITPRGFFTAIQGLTGVQTVAAIKAGLGVDVALVSEAIATNPRANVQSFLAPGDWVKPSNATMVMAMVLAAGGGGASGAHSGGGARAGGSGGGGGQYITQLFTAAELAASVPVTVGAAGIGGASQTVTGQGVDGGDGGFSSFGSLLRALGGAGGIGGLGGTGYSGGAGGGFAGAGSGGESGVDGGNGDDGGAGGGGAAGGAIAGHGGNSNRGGSGGGAGGSYSSITSFAAGHGGAPAHDVGGAAGVASVGSPGVRDLCGGGGGAALGYAGGSGGLGAGGGGGGGGNTGSPSGAGGAGGAGRVRIITW